MVVGALLLSGLAAAVPAQADTYPIKISTVASAKLSASTIKVKKKVTGTARVVFTAKALEIPLPAKGFYVNSFPLKNVKQPSLKASNVPLDSRKYGNHYNTYLKKAQWEVRGSRDFWGELKVEIAGSATGKTKGVGYFYGGTYTCGSGCINDHAIKKLTVKK